MPNEEGAGLPNEAENQGEQGGQDENVVTFNLDEIPEKFRSNPTEVFKSFENLERRLSGMGQEKSDLEAQLNDLYERQSALEQTYQQAQRQAQYQPQEDPYLVAYESAMEQGDYRAALAIQANLMQKIAAESAPTPQPAKASPNDFESWAFVAEQHAIEAVGGREEWDRYREIVEQEAKNENWQGLSAAQAGQKLARLYKMVKADDVLNNQKTLAEQQAEADRARKMAAQSMGGSGGRPEQPTQDEAAVDAILKAAHEGSYDHLMRS
jgi:hypothetical protein